MFALFSSIKSSLPFALSTGSGVVDAELRDAAVEPALSPRRRQLISQILATNITATYAFLEQFDDHDLELYARHLDLISGPRDLTSMWSRPTTGPAFIGRVALT